MNITHSNIISFNDNDYEGFKGLQLTIRAYGGSLFILNLVHEL